MADILRIENNVIVGVTDTSIISVTIPSTVIGIADRAFINCTSLSSITIPDSVKKIGKGAFEGCTNLTNLTIPFIGRSLTNRSGNTYLGYIFGANSYKDNAIKVPILLKTLTITGGESLGKNALYDCYWIEDLILGKNVTNIRHDAFIGANGRIGLKSIKIDEENPAYYSANNDTLVIEKATGTVVRGCSTTEVIIPKEVNTIGIGAFSGCTGIETINFEEAEGLKSIQDYAFENCTKLKNISLPDTLIAINEGVFKGCRSLASISVPKNIKTIEDFAFKDCSSLKSILFIEDCDLREIKEHAFEKCTSLQNIELPVSLELLGNYAFSKCSNLSTVVLSTGINTIKAYAFNNCTSLASINLPDSLVNIENAAFYNCSKLVNISLPTSITKLNKHLFANCSSLTEISLQDADTLESNIYKIGHNAFNSCIGIENLVIPNSVIEIEHGAFEGLANLASIELPFIGDSKRRPVDTWFGHIFGATEATQNSEKVPATLQSIKINNGKTVAKDSFINCQNIKSIELNGNFESIEDQAFSGCSSLETIEIPDSIANLGVDAFKDCNNLSYYDYYNGKYLGNATSNYLVLSKAASTEIETCAIHSDTKVIESSAFKNCKKLPKVDIHGNVVNVGHRAFENCEDITVYCEKTSKPANWADDWDIVGNDKLVVDEEGNEQKVTPKAKVIWNFKKDRDASSGSVTMVLRNGKKVAIKRCKIYRYSNTNNMYYDGFGWAFSADFNIETICDNRRWTYGEIHDDIISSAPNNYVYIYDFDAYQDDELMKIRPGNDDYTDQSANEAGHIFEKYDPVAVLKFTAGDISLETKDTWSLIDLADYQNE